jgi:hypothetical protein
MLSEPRATLQHVNVLAVGAGGEGAVAVPGGISVLHLSKIVRIEYIKNFFAFNHSCYVARSRMHSSIGIEEGDWQRPPTGEEQCR